MDISSSVCPGCGKLMTPVRTRCDDCELTLEGAFEIPPLARLPQRDQLFVIAFLRHHGSIKKMESLFGISYPTVKNRLSAIVAQLDRDFEGPSSHAQTLALLERGEISVQEALRRMGA
ncbi:MAG: DUF2089 family protein [Candidatus Eisenbacteria bacterium]|nr:DUF2089 family protein [Candidatus Eisenbacteria bacterium]